MRTFKTGATRDGEGDKFDYDGFLSPRVLERYARYMYSHRTQADGKLRSSSNWKNGMPKDVYMKSLWRHFMDVWGEHHGIESKDGQEEALCAMMFNVMGYLFETLREV